MRTAKNLWWAHKLFDPYLSSLLKRHFHGLYLLENVPEPDPDLPLLLLPNHSTWWDGLFVYWLNKILFKRPIFIMMLEAQLKKYYFFSQLGAYGIDPANPNSILKSLNYTVELFKQTSPRPPLICIFPQGELLPWGKRPLVFKPGIEWIMKKYQAPVNVLLLAIRSEHLKEKLPETFFLFHKNNIYDSQNFPGSAALAAREKALLEILAGHLISTTAQKKSSALNILPGSAASAPEIDTNVHNFSKRYW